MTWFKCRTVWRSKTDRHWARVFRSKGRLVAFKEWPPRERQVFDVTKEPGADGQRRQLTRGVRIVFGCQPARSVDSGVRGTRGAECDVLAQKVISLELGIQGRTRHAYVKPAHPPNFNLGRVGLGEWWTGHTWTVTEVVGHRCSPRWLTDWTGWSEGIKRDALESKKERVRERPKWELCRASVFRA